MQISLTRFFKRPWNLEMLSFSELVVALILSVDVFEAIKDRISDEYVSFKINVWSYLAT